MLGDLPVIGSLFRSREVRQTQSELVILLMPEVLSQLRAQLLGQEGLDNVRAAQPPLPKELHPNEQ